MFPRPPPEFLRQHRAAWWHGDYTSSDFLHDAQHPGLWLASDVEAALWYATHPVTLKGQLHAVEVSGEWPSLNHPETFIRLCEAAQVSLAAAQRSYQRGTLYLDHQEELCQAARLLGFDGLHMKDHTLHPHDSLVIWNLSRARILATHTFTGPPHTASV